MGDAKLYSAHDIDKLKQKIAIYKDTLTTLKTGDSIEDYLYMKNEFQDFKMKVNNLEGLKEIVDEKQNMQLRDYRQKINSLTDQIDSLNQTVEGLNLEISSIRNKVQNSDSVHVLEEIKTVPDLLGSLSAYEKIERDEEEYIVVNTSRTDEHSNFPSIQNSDTPLSYTQLQDFIKKLQNEKRLLDKEIPSKLNANQTNAEEVQPYFRKPNTPLNNITPDQLYNNLSINRNGKSTTRLNHPVPTRRFSVKCCETKSFLLSEGLPEQNDMEAEQLDIKDFGGFTEQTLNTDFVEENVEKLEISEETNQQEENYITESSFIQLESVAAFEENGVSKIVEKMNPAENGATAVESSELAQDRAQAEDNEVKLEVPKEADQQETKSNGMLSFLKFFRKSN